MFFNQLAKYGDKLAVIDGEFRISYAQLNSLCQETAQQLNKNTVKSVVFVQASNSLAGLVAYLSCLQTGHCAVMLNPSICSSMFESLIDLYHPECIIRADSGLLPQITWQKAEVNSNIDANIALLLSTSGSTGAPKQVALSYTNLQSNAQSIVDYLPLQQSDKGLCNLPLFYSYGLSVVNSHLLKGACCVFTQTSPVNRQFWELIEFEGISSFAGVPHSYQMMLRLGLTSKPLPSIRYFTQAGGKLEPTLVKQLAQYAEQTDKQFFVMYGQTEATARMAYLAPQKAATKPHAIGQAIPGGVLRLVDSTGQCIEQDNTEGELVYYGDNVMLGYVSCRAELQSLVPLKDLHTGDLGYRDDEGDFVVTGRLKRIIKPFGQRIALDDAERLLAQHGEQSYCTGDDKKLVIALLYNGEEDKALWAQQRKREFAKLFDLHSSAIKVLVLNSLPMNDNGKKDYQAIMQRLQQGHLYD